MGWDYLSRLKWAARWYLSPAEAAEVLEDYREIVAGRSEEELRRDLGTPRAAMKQLAQPRAYRRWVTVFAVLAVCVLLPIVMANNDVYWSPIIKPVYMIALCLGSGVSLRWFRRNGVRGNRLPRTVLVLLVLILLGMVWVWFWAGLVLTESWALLNTIAAAVIRPRTLHWYLVLEVLAMGAVSLYGLVKARLGDRRWRAVYVLGLAGVILSLSVWGLFNGMDLSFSAPNWQTPILLRYTEITLLGLIGTAVSLC